jgi:hypothetical protein
MRKNFFVLFILLSFLIPQSAIAVSGDEKTKAVVTITKAERKMAEAITAEQLRDYLSFIASDAMGGRNTPSPGLDITAQFIAFNLKRWGFKPAGDDGTYFQKMYVKSESIESTDLDVGGSKFKYGDDYVKLSGESIPSAPLVFAKDGWMVKSKNIDAYEGIDVKDKLVVLYTDRASRGISPPRPKGVTDEDLKGEKGVDWANPASYAEMKGAKGIVVVMSPAIEQRWAGIKRFFMRGGASIEGLGGRGGDAPGIPTLLVS